MRQVWHGCGVTDDLLGKGMSHRVWYRLVMVGEEEACTNLETYVGMVEDRIVDFVCGRILRSGCRGAI